MVYHNICDRVKELVKDYKNKSVKYSINYYFLDCQNKVTMTIGLQKVYPYFSLSLLKNVST
jgi:hypothetical protein